MHKRALGRQRFPNPSDWAKASGRFGIILSNLVVEPQKLDDEMEQEAELRSRIQRYSNVDCRATELLPCHRHTKSFKLHGALELSGTLQDDRRTQVAT